MAPLRNLFNKLWALVQDIKFVILVGQPEPVSQSSPVSFSELNICWPTEATTLHSLPLSAWKQHVNMGMQESTLRIHTVFQPGVTHTQTRLFNSTRLEWVNTFNGKKYEMQRHQVRRWTMGMSCYAAIPAYVTTRSERCDGVCGGYSGCFLHASWFFSLCLGRIAAGAKLGIRSTWLEFYQPYTASEANHLPGPEGSSRQHILHIST